MVDVRVMRASRPLTFEPQDLAGDGAAIEERGRALLFDILLWGQPARAFVLRADGLLRAYVNRCSHVPTELDWLPGEFLDSERRDILCAVHGASYDVHTGACIGGPCAQRGGLMAIRVDEASGRLRWWPTGDVQPLPAPTPPG